jgi:hypothetical protein
MQRIFVCAVLCLLLLHPSNVLARCGLFTASTMDVGGAPKAQWRTDYPGSAGRVTAPWQSIDFKADPTKYMLSVLETAKPYFKRDGRKLVGTGAEPWWISLWLDYTNYGREPYMGLTKERGPDEGDLSETSRDGYQVWAVGFYNAPGSTVLGNVFGDACNPQLPASVNFPEGTVSIKFLFTDADPGEVTYLAGAAEYDANIDVEGAGSGGRPVTQRRKRIMRLLQVDISVKDASAAETKWVFGTFGWVGPPKGDGLFDNLLPVSLQWGNDPGVYDTRMVQGWVNPALQGIMYGWSTRSSLGFNGRANGPADNIRSSCLSCHAAARIPRSSKGLLGFQFDMENDIQDAAKVRSHVDFWFQNVKGGELFHDTEPAVSALDYSLQLEAAMYRLCQACKFGDLGGATPPVCRAAKFYDQPMCRARTITFDATIESLKRKLDEEPPPRQ